MSFFIKKDNDGYKTLRWGCVMGIQKINQWKKEFAKTFL